MLTILIPSKEASLSRCLSPVAMHSAPACCAHSRIRLSGSSARIFSLTSGLTTSAILAMRLTAALIWSSSQ